MHLRRLDARLGIGELNERTGGGTEFAACDEDRFCDGHQRRPLQFVEPL
jgi:hypothetical protein